MSRDWSLFSFNNLPPPFLPPKLICSHLDTIAFSNWKMGYLQRKFHTFRHEIEVMHALTHAESFLKKRPFLASIFIEFFRPTVSSFSLQWIFSSSSQSFPLLCMMIIASWVDLRIYACVYARYYSTLVVYYANFLSSSIIRRIPMSEQHRYHVGRSNWCCFRVTRDWVTSLKATTTLHSTHYSERFVVVVQFAA